MEWFRLALEYLRVFLSTQVIVGIIVIIFFKMFREEIKEFITRIVTLRLPGGGEVSTPQLEKIQTDKPVKNNTSPEPQSADLPSHIQENDLETLKSLYNSERARAYFWEYSYLNYFLVPKTQLTLDWLASYESPISIPQYDTFTSPVVPEPKERKAILDALESHYLVIIKDNLISVSPKGHEYIEWRGLVHQSRSSSSL
mgnify:CR=1 FL=1